MTRVEVTPAEATLPIGITQKLTATGVYSDATTKDLTTQVSWSSDAAASAMVSPGGIVSGVAVGSATISATSGAVRGTTKVTVSAAQLASIAVTPSDAGLPLGLTEALVATGTFSDRTTLELTDQVTWASSAEARVKVSNADGSRGAAEAVAVGAVTISATLFGVTGATTLTVTPATLASIAITPGDPEVPVGLTQQLTATGTFSDKTTEDLTTRVTWASDQAARAAVSTTGDSKGLATAKAEGNATITATLDGVAGTTTLEVIDAVVTSIAITPTDPNVPVGFPDRLVATGTLSDGTTRDLTTQVVWTSDDEEVATVSNADGSRGLVTTKVEGAAKITAALDEVTGTTTLTVTGALLAAISITPTNPKVPLGLTQQLVATGTFDDSSTRDLTTVVSWASDGEAVAAVSSADGSRGLATARAVGAATITATFDGATGARVLTVTDAALRELVVAPVDPELPVGLAQRFTAIGTFSDASTKELTEQVTWASDDEAVATVSNADGSRGVATAKAVGDAAVSATLEGVTGSATLTVTSAVVTSIAITPADPKVPVGLLRSLTATGTFSDSSTRDVTDEVTWASDKPEVAEISNADGSRGLAAAKALGDAKLTATLNGATGATTLTVTAPVLILIAITPVDPRVPVGLNAQLTATGRFSDRSARNLTADATWASQSDAIATVSTADGSEGLVTALGAGATEISATADGVTGKTMLTVTEVETAAVGAPISPRLQGSAPALTSAAAM